MTFTIISLFFILILSYFTLGHNLSRPSVLYVLGFLLCALMANNYEKGWGLDKMSPVTIFVLVGGALMFYLVELYYYRKHPQWLKGVNLAYEEFIPIKPFKLFLFLLFQITAIVMMARSEMSYAMTDELSEAMATVSEDSKFEKIQISHPFYIQQPYNICMAARNIWCILLPFYLFQSKKYNSQKFLLGLNMLAGSLGTLVTGSRTNLLYDIIAIIIFGYICFQYRINWRGGLFPRKITLVITALAIIFSLSFAQLGYAIGRKENDNPITLIFAIYCGAQIKNLDDYIQYPFKQGNEAGLPAQYTLCGMYDSYQNRFEGVKGVRMNQPDLRFNSYGIYPLGNVYTTYFNYILDFGIIGAVLVAGIMALICSFLYRKATTSAFWRTGYPNLWLVYFIYKVPGACFLSFFANKFFEGVTLSGTLKTLLYWWIIILFLYGREKGVPSKMQEDI